MFFSSVSFLFRPESLLGLIFPTAGKNDLILILKRRNIPPKNVSPAAQNHGVVMGSSIEKSWGRHMAQKRADDPDDPKKKSTGNRG